MSRISRPSVVVTGSGGMGAAIARRIGAGTNLVLADASEEQLNRTTDALRDEGYLVHPQLVDVGEAASVRRLAATAAEVGPVQTVVHTAGISPNAGRMELILRVNLLGTALILDAFGDVIAEGGSGVMISSMSGHRVRLGPDAEHAFAHTPTEELLSLPAADPAGMDDAEHCYGTTKRANQLRVRSASVTWGRRGARVNSISPGIISTPMSRAELEGPYRQIMLDMIDAGGAQRVGTPGDIAEAVAFLAGPGASFITGTDLLVDGGVIAAFEN